MEEMTEKVNDEEDILEASEGIYIIKIKGGNESIILNSEKKRDCCTEHGTKFVSIEDLNKPMQILDQKYLLGGTVSK